MEERHDWTVEDDLVALYVQKFELGSLPWKSRKAVAEHCGLKPNSLKARKDNLDWLASGGKKGLSNVADQTRAVFAKYGHLSEPDMKALAFPGLAKTR